MTILFIEADEPLLVFSSVEMAEQYLEAVDVRSGVYKRAFGQAGELYSIKAEGEIVAIRAIEQPADPDSLYELLRRSLHEVGVAFPPDADLPTLVAATEAFWTKPSALRLHHISVGLRGRGLYAGRTGRVYLGVRQRLLTTICRR